MAAAGTYRRKEVGWVGWITGFVDRVDEGVFPGFGNVGKGYARVDQMQEHPTNRVETHPKHVNADAVVAAG